MNFLVNPDDPHDLVQLGDRRVPRRVSVAVSEGHAGQPAILMDLEVIGDRPQCRQIRVISAEGGREVRQLDLDAIRIADWIEDVFAFVAVRADEGSDTLIERLATAEMPYSATTVRQAMPEAVKAIQHARKGRSARKVTPEFLAEIAAVYRRNVGVSPTQAVADAFGIAHSTAAEYVRRARASELLPPTTPGKRKA